MNPETTSTQENRDVVGKMITGLQRNGSDYALGYLESFIVKLMDDFVKDPLDLERIRLRMLAAGINGLLDAEKRALDNLVRTR